MKYDSFTISRYVFLLFLVIIATYFLVENKTARPSKHVEKFEEETKPATQASSSQKPVEAKPSSTTSSTKEAPKAGSGEMNNNSTCVSCGDKPEESKYLSKTDDKAAVAEINSIYKELFQTPPSEEEIAFYTDYIKNRNVTRDSLREVIATSAPALRKTIPSKNRGLLETIGTEKDVIMVFNEVLQRNPDREELYQFSLMLKDDKTFNVDKLKQILIVSEEYKRMEKTQSNIAFTSLRGEVTDRQLTMLVYKLYKDVTQKEYVDEDTLRFLKKKYTEFNLDDAMLKDFIAKYIANKPFEMKSSSSTSKTSTSTSNAADAAKKDESASQKAMSIEEIEALKKSIREELLKEMSSSSSTKEADANAKKLEEFQGKNYITDSVIIFGDRPNSELLSTLAAKSSQGSSSGSVDSNKLVDTIKKEGSCSYFKDVKENELQASGQKQLADYIESRNRNHLKNVCERNKTYMNASDDMVLFPEFKWEVPQRQPPVCVGRTGTVNPLMDQSSLIGTLLTDAQDTSVGSILPKNPPV